MPFLKMTKEICENCGHGEHWHQLVKPKFCLQCSCKKFIPQKKILLFCDNPACFAKHLADKNY